MKTMICCFIFLCLRGYPQNISREMASKIFGERFIPAENAGFPANLEIPYTEDMVRYDCSSWLVPLKIKDKPQYLLIQARYLPNSYDLNDTLGLKETLEAIKVLRKTSFPNAGCKKQPMRFFYRTKDLAPSRYNMVLKKTVAYNDTSCTVVDLPILARSGILETKFLTYFVENSPGQSIMGFEPLPKGSPMIDELYICVLTIIYLKPI